MKEIPANQPDYALRSHPNERDGHALDVPLNMSIPCPTAVVVAYSQLVEGMHGNLCRTSVLKQPIVALQVDSTFRTELRTYKLSAVAAATHPSRICVSFTELMYDVNVNSGFPASSLMRAPGKPRS